MLGPVNAPRQQRGLSLVELMISLVLGLFVVGSASTLLLGQLRENRAALVESRLMQDLRASVDLLTRDLRRAGYWGSAGAALWYPGTSAQLTNPYSAVAPATAASDAVSFRFSRDSAENSQVDSNEQFGFRLRKGVVEMLLGAGGWQAMTDANTMVVELFSVTPVLREIALQGSCDKPCPSGGDECMPKQQQRSLAIEITVHAVTDPQVVRSLRSEVRLRNDVIVGHCPA
jgi:prepilin peptidase dependent protein B